MYFSAKGQIMMSSMTKYLLEESRVVYQDKGLPIHRERGIHIYTYIREYISKFLHTGERNYNVFYLACASWGKEIMADESASMDPKKLNYLNKSGCYTVQNRDDYAMFEEMMRCFDQLGFSQREQVTLILS